MFDPIHPRSVIADTPLPSSWSSRVEINAGTGINFAPRPPEGRPRNRPGSFRRRVRSRSLRSDSQRRNRGGPAVKKDTEKMALHIVRKGFDSREVLFQHS